MCEESECLVPPSEPVRNAPPSHESRQSTATEYNSETLIGFHEDALTQAAMGRAQHLLIGIVGLGLAADCAETQIVNFILPAAELHLCIEEHQKESLVGITLWAMACGSLFWGVLADCVGRKKALILALTVAALFSPVATVMPTYGTFMTARFGSGLGISGAFPIAFSYVTENCSRSSRARYAGFLHSMWPLGALYIALIFECTMPTLGADIVQDNREHWSSFHRFLLLSILPTLGCLIGVLWSSESPRFLLEASREVEALAVYQRLHKLNQTRTQYGLTELELPNRNSRCERPASPTHNAFFYGYEAIKQAFQNLISYPYGKASGALIVLHFISGYLNERIPALFFMMMKKLRQSHYIADKKIVEFQNFSRTFNESIENVLFNNCVFKNSTFTHLHLVHVNFFNCSIEESEFIDVKTSKFSFEHSVIKNSRFIDTDLTEHHFTKCDLINNTFLSLISNCVLDFDYNIYLDDVRIDIEVVFTLMIPVLIGIGFLMGSNVWSRSKLLMFLWIVTGYICLGIIFLTFSLVWFLIFTTCLQLFLHAIVTVTTLIVLEAFPCRFRCSAHGIMRSIYHGAAIVSSLFFSYSSEASLIYPACFTATLCFLGAFVAKQLEDNSKVLL